MTPLEFLAVVLPSSGLGSYCAVELTRKKQHVFKDTIADFQPYIDSWNADHCDIFYAVSCFEGNKREAEKATHIRSFFVDLDGYASKKAAVLALDAFMAKVGLDKLGKPWIVGSGGGLHCYWPITRDMTIDEWRRPAKVEAEEDEPPAPAPKAKKAKPAPVAEDEGEEPTVRKEEKKPSAVPAKKSNLAAMVDDWDEE